MSNPAENDPNEHTGGGAGQDDLDKGPPSRPAVSHLPDYDSLVSVPDQLEQGEKPAAAENQNVDLLTGQGAAAELEEPGFTIHTHPASFDKETSRHKLIIPSKYGELFPIFKDGKAAAGSTTVNGSLDSVNALFDFVVVKAHYTTNKGKKGQIGTASVRHDGKHPITNPKDLKAYENTWEHNWMRRWFMRRGHSVSAVQSLSYAALGWGFKGLNQKPFMVKGTRLNPHEDISLFAWWLADENEKLRVLKIYENPEQNDIGSHGSFKLQKRPLIDFEPSLYTYNEGSPFLYRTSTFIIQIKTQDGQEITLPKDLEKENKSLGQQILKLPALNRFRFVEGSGIQAEGGGKSPRKIKIQWKTLDKATFDKFFHVFGEYYRHTDGSKGAYSGEKGWPQGKQLEALLNKNEYKIELWERNVFDAIWREGEIPAMNKLLQAIFELRPSDIGYHLREPTIAYVCQKLGIRDFGPPLQVYRKGNQLKDENAWRSVKGEGGGSRSRSSEKAGGSAESPHFGSGSSGSSGAVPSKAKKVAKGSGSSDAPGPSKAKKAAKESGAPGATKGVKKKGGSEKPEPTAKPMKGGKKKGKA